MRDEKEPPAGGQGGADNSAYGDSVDKSSVTPDAFNCKGVTPSSVFYYHDAEGLPVYAVARFERGTLDPKRKQFPQWRWEAGKWLPGLNKGTLPLYGLHLLAGADPVLFAEGEKCADALRELGYTATTLPGGTGNTDKWLKARSDALQMFAGVTCYVPPDNDAAGTLHAGKVAQALREAGANVRLLTPDAWAHLGKGADVYDWIQEGNGRAELDALLESAAPVDVPAPSVPAEPTNAPTTDLPPPPLDALPGNLGEYIQAEAESRCVDPAMPFTFALGVAASAIGRAAEIELRPGWREIAPLWIGHIAPPGKLKSPTLKALAAPMFTYDDELEAEHAAALAIWQTECEVAKAKKQAPPARPARVQAIAGDTTIEALGDVLDVSPRVAGIYDELGALFDGMGAYKKNGGHDRQSWLSLHAGTRLTINRKGKDPVIVPEPRLGVIGATTPATAARVLNPLNGDGMIDRFLLTTSRTVANRFSTPPVPEHLRLEYDESIARLRRLPTTSARVVMLSPEAAAIFGDFYESLDVEAVPAHFQGVVGKLAGHVGRIALTLTLLENAQAVVVSGDTMRAAIRIGQWLAQHTANARSVNSLSANLNALSAWLRKQGGRAFLRDVVRAGVAGVGTTEQAEALCAELVRARVADWGSHETTAGNSRREIILTGGTP